MLFRTSTQIAATATAVLLSAPLQAQSLSEIVVQEYFDQIEASGLTVEIGNQSTDGTTAEWTDIILRAPEDVVIISIPWLKAEAVSQGTVSVTYARRITATGKPVTQDQASPIDIVVNSSEDSAYLISGSPEMRNYATTSALTQVAMGGADSPLVMNIDFQNMTCNFDMTGAENRNSKGSCDASAMVMNYQVADHSRPGQEMDMVMASEVAGLSFSFDADSISVENIAELMNGTRNFATEYSMGLMTQKSSVTQPGASFDISASAESGNGTISLNNGIFDMTGISNGIKYLADMSKMGLPAFEAAMDSADMAFSMPLRKQDEPQPAALKLKMNQLVVSDSLWAMIDPGASLPRDPAVLNIDLGMMMKWLIDPAQKPDPAKLMTSAPIEVDSVEIKNIFLQIAGASLNGTGAAKINNTGPIPEPVGEVNLSLKGGFALLDKLSALGLVPIEQSVMIRGMSGVFTVPGDGEDHLISKIEMQPGGAVLANGNRIK